MANYSIKTDLLKLQGAFVTNIKGKTATKKCLCIPIEGSGLFLGEKGCYLNMTAIEMQNPHTTTPTASRSPTTGKCTSA